MRPCTPEELAKFIKTAPHPPEWRQVFLDRGEPIPFGARYNHNGTWRDCDGVSKPNNLGILWPILVPPRSTGWMRVHAPEEEIASLKKQLAEREAAIRQLQDQLDDIEDD